MLIDLVEVILKTIPNVDLCFPVYLIPELLAKELESAAANDDLKHCETVLECLIPLKGDRLVAISSRLVQACNVLVLKATAPPLLTI